MYRQAEFDFGLSPQPWRPKNPERLYFCIKLEAADQDRFGDLQNAICKRCEIVGNQILKPRLHVSLKPVGDYRILRQKFIFGACRAGDLIDLPSFEVTFRRFGSFHGRPASRSRPPSRPLVLLADDGPVCDLSHVLGVALSSQMRRNGMKAGGHFTPHMTLAYDEQFVQEQSMNEIKFTAREFVLVHSLRGLTIYHILQRWPLRSH